MHAAHAGCTGPHRRGNLVLSRRLEVSLLHDAVCENGQPATDLRASASQILWRRAGSTHSRYSAAATDLSELERGAPPARSIQCQVKESASQIGRASCRERV